MAKLTLKQLCDAPVKADLGSKSRMWSDRVVLLPRFDDITLEAKRNNLISKFVELKSQSAQNTYHNASGTFIWMHIVTRLTHGFTQAEFESDCHCTRVWNWLKRAGIIQVSRKVGNVYYYKSVYAKQYLNYRETLRDKNDFLYGT